MAEREVCIGCGHDIGMHFNDVTGRARCLVSMRHVHAGLSTAYDEPCKCLDFQCPHPVYVDLITEKTIERLKAAFAAKIKDDRAKG